MKHFVKLAILLFLVLIAFAACTSGPNVTGGVSNNTQSGTVASDEAKSSDMPTDSNKFADVADKDWRLAEIRSAGKTVTINRTPPASFANVDLSGWFGIRFQNGQVNGAGAPNRYFGTYTLADNQAISMGPMASTQMASFYEPTELKEHEYFAHLQNVNRWNLSGGNLELHSRADGTETVLVFTLTK